MIKHVVHWPEVGIIEESESSEGTDDAEELQQWMEHPFLKKILLSMYVGSRLLSIATILVMASLFLSTVGRFSSIQFTSQTAIVWGFIGATGAIMFVDEAVKKFTDKSIRLVAFVLLAVIVGVCGTLYFRIKLGRESLVSPESIQIDAIPVLELFSISPFDDKRQNRIN